MIYKKKTTHNLKYDLNSTVVNQLCFIHNGESTHEFNSRIHSGEKTDEFNQDLFILVKQLINSAMIGRP